MRGFLHAARVELARIERALSRNVCHADDDAAVPPQTESQPQAGYGYFVQNGNGQGLPNLIFLNPTPGGGAVVPGPQITVLRSVVPTTPTTTVWASSGYVDFVADCGADPTGATDCTAALNQAFVYLSALAASPYTGLPVETAVTLFIPPGVYLVTGNPNPWTFAAAPTTVIVRGAGSDASIFLIGQLNPGDSFLVLKGVLASAIVSDLTFVGLGDGSVPDTNLVLEISTEWHNAVRDCRFLYLSATSAVIFTESDLVVCNCDFQQSACLSSGAGQIWSTDGGSLDVSHCRFSDIAQLNGFVMPTAKEAASTDYIHADTSTFLQVRVSQCFFDEGTQTAVTVDGGGTLSTVRIEECYSNAPVNLGQVAAYRFTGCQSVVIDGCYQNHATGNEDIPLALLTGVNFFRLRGQNINPGTLCRFVKADATTGLVRVEDSTYAAAADVYDGTAARSLAQTNEMLTAGSDTIVECTPLVCDAAGSYVGAVHKIAPVSAIEGATLVLASDGTGLAAFVSLDVAAGSAPIRLARRGQRVTMESDGTTTIAIGDPVTTFGAAAAGQVLLAASLVGGPFSLIGTACTAVAAGAPAPVDVLFEPGVIGL